MGFGWSCFKKIDIIAIFMKMYCEARVGMYLGVVEDLARQYSEKFIQIPFGLPDVKKTRLSRTIRR